MAQEIAAPQRQDRKGGIKDIVDFVLNDRLSGPADTFGWEDSGCVTEAHDTRMGCYDERVDPGLDDPKVAGGVEIRSLIEKFPRYLGVSCWIGGDQDGPDYESQAGRNLTAVEDREVEARIWAWAAAAPTPGTAASLVAAIGAAEEEADEEYVGLPVLIISRSAATQAFAAGALERVNDRLFTANGTPVLATHVASDDEVAIIGWPVVLASPLRTYRAPNTTTNVDLAIAERVYAFGVDCDYRYAVSVTAP